MLLLTFKLVVGHYVTHPKQDDYLAAFFDFESIDAFTKDALPKVADLWLKDQGKVEIFPKFEQGLLQIEALNLEVQHLEIKGDRRLGLGIKEAKKPQDFLALETEILKVLSSVVPSSWQDYLIA